MRENLLFFLGTLLSKINRKNNLNIWYNCIFQSTDIVTKISRNAAYKIIFEFLV